MEWAKLVPQGSAVFLLYLWTASFSGASALALRTHPGQYTVSNTNPSKASGEPQLSAANAPETSKKEAKVTTPREADVAGGEMVEPFTPPSTPPSTPRFKRHPAAEGDWNPEIWTADSANYHADSSDSDAKLIQELSQSLPGLSRRPSEARWSGGPTARRARAPWKKLATRIVPRLDLSGYSDALMHDGSDITPTEEEESLSPPPIAGRELPWEFGGPEETFVEPFVRESASEEFREEPFAKVSKEEEAVDWENVQIPIALRFINGDEIELGAFPDAVAPVVAAATAVLEAESWRRVRQERNDDHPEGAVTSDNDCMKEKKKGAADDVLMKKAEEKDTSRGSSCSHGQKKDGVLQKARACVGKFVPSLPPFFQPLADEAATPARGHPRSLQLSLMRCHTSAETPVLPAWARRPSPEVFLDTASVADVLAESEDTSELSLTELLVLAEKFQEKQRRLQEDVQSEDAEQTSVVPAFLREPEHYWKRGGVAFTILWKPRRFRLRIRDTCLGEWPCSTVGWGGPKRNPLHMVVTEEMRIFDIETFIFEQKGPTFFAPGRGSVQPTFALVDGDDEIGGDGNVDDVFLHLHNSTSSVANYIPRDQLKESYEKAAKSRNQKWAVRYDIKPVRVENNVFSRFPELWSVQLSMTHLLAELISKKEVVFSSQMMNFGWRPPVEGADVRAAATCVGGAGARRRFESTVHWAEACRETGGRRGAGRGFPSRTELEERTRRADRALRDFLHARERRRQLLREQATSVAFEDIQKLFAKRGGAPGQPQPMSLFRKLLDNRWEFPY